MPKMVYTGQSEWGWHQLDDARCLQLYGARHVFDRPDVQIPAQHLVFGSMLHLVLGQHYKRLQLEAKGSDPDIYYTPDQALEVMGEKLSPTERKFFDEKYTQTMQMYDQYTVKYGHDSRWEVIGVEDELRLKATDRTTGKKYLYTQGEDLRIRDKVTGKYHSVDHKSTYAIMPRVTKRLETDGQFVGYWVFGRLKYGENYGGPMINFLKKPVQAKDGTWSKWEFQRAVVPYAPGLTGNLKQLIIHRRRQIDALAGEPLKNYPKEFSQHTCWSAYGPCALTKYCHGKLF